MRSIHLSRGLLASLLLVGLSACGGGGAGVADATVANEPPASASTTDAGLVDYTVSLAQTPAESAPPEPVDLSNFTPPPTSETALPVATSADEAV
jgi:hypothetical protein